MDAVDGRDDAFDSSAGLLNRRVGVTQSMTDDNRREILVQLSSLAATYHDQPRRSRGRWLIMALRLFRCI